MEISGDQWRVDDMEGMDHRDHIGSGNSGDEQRHQGTIGPGNLGESLGMETEETPVKDHQGNRMK